MSNNNVIVSRICRLWYRRCGCCYGGGGDSGDDSAFNRVHCHAHTISPTRHGNSFYKPCNSVVPHADTDGTATNNDTICRLSPRRCVGSHHVGLN
eukprot:UC1_evm4s1759